MNKIVDFLAKNHEIIAIFAVFSLIFSFILSINDLILWFILAVILYKTITFRINIAKWQAYCQIKKKKRR